MIGWVMNVKSKMLREWKGDLRGRTRKEQRLSAEYNFLQEEYCNAGMALEGGSEYGTPFGLLVSKYMMRDGECIGDMGFEGTITNAPVCISKKEKIPWRNNTFIYSWSACRCNKCVQERLKGRRDIIWGIASRPEYKKLRRDKYSAFHPKNKNVLL